MPFRTLEMLEMQFRQAFRVGRIIGLEFKE